MNKDFDVIVVGAGPGGYVCAIRSAQLGLKTALIEKDHLGGTCTNIGCIPSKALLDSSKLYEQITKKSSNHGIFVSETNLDLVKMLERKDKIVSSLRKGINTLLNANKIKLYSGFGKLINENEISVNGQNISGSNIVLATGSKPKELPFIPFDGQHIINSTDALSLDKAPKELLVLGAGAIGLELGQLWSRLGSQVTIIELLPSIAPGCDTKTSKILERSLKKQGMKFLLETEIKSYEIDSKITLSGHDSKGKNIKLEGDKVLIAAGRTPNIDFEALNLLNIKYDKKTNFVQVDENFKTSKENIYAIGDIIKGPMLAHKAEKEGLCLAEYLYSGKKSQVNFDNIPGVIYTCPEMATIGKTEDDLKDSNYSVGTFNFRANGRAICMESTDGMVKLLANDEKKCIGAHIVGPNASDLLSEIVLLMNLNCSVSSIFHSIHAHPTLSECVKDSAMDLYGSSINAISHKKLDKNFL